MRKREYISPSALQLFDRNKEEFYLTYLADHKPARMPQTQPMSIGSALDARVKHFLVKELRGTVPPEFELRKIFEDQVEEHNREWAWLQSEKLFEKYKDSGALTDLLLDLSQSIIEPRFEFTVMGELKIRDLVIPLSGKPDLFFVTENKARIIVDWKVNGYCSKSGVSPKKGYIKLRPGGKVHKDVVIGEKHGIKINMAHFMEEIDRTWADQLAIYAWVLKEPLCSDFIVQIEQFACNPLAGHYNDPQYMVDVRIATHRCLVSPQYQKRLLDRLCICWEAINSDWVFRELSYEDSLKKQAELDERAEMLYKMKTSDDENERYYAENIR